MRLVRLNESVSENLIKKVFNFHIDKVTNNYFTIVSDDVPLDTRGGSYYYDHFLVDGSNAPLRTTAKYKIVLEYRKGISGADIEISKLTMDLRGVVILDEGIGKGHIKNVRPSIKNSDQLCGRIIDIINEFLSHEIRVKDNVASVSHYIGGYIVKQLQKELPTK